MQTAVNHKFALAMEFSNVEKRDMVECYIQCQRNSTRAAEVYFKNYFDRCQPWLPTFKRLWDNLADYGSFVKPKSKKGMDEDREINILASMCRSESIYIDPTNFNRNGLLSTHYCQSLEEA